VPWIPHSKVEIAALAKAESPPVGAAWKIEPCCVGEHAKHDYPEAWIVVSIRPGALDRAGSMHPANAIGGVRKSKATAKKLCQEMNDYHREHVKTKQQKLRQR
jgi:hypothetical protein